MSLSVHTLHRLTQLRYVRLMLAAWVLIFSLNSFAHAAHTHADGPASIHAACGYCLTFDALQAPTASCLHRIAHEFTREPAATHHASFISRTITAAVPRGPPHA